MRFSSSALLLPLLALASCSGGGSQQSSPDANGGSGVFEIISCSLACSASGNSLTCGFSSVAINEELAIEFNRPIDISSVNGNSFQLTQSPQGAQPPGVFTVDETNPRRLIFRPELTFDSQGNPQFGLVSLADYELTIPGVLQSPDLPTTSFLRSVSGEPNLRRLTCLLTADQGVNDLSPGSPRVDVYVDQVSEFDPETQEPIAIERRVLANGPVLLRNVYRETDIELVFNDVMNPATLVNPVTGEALFIEIVIDPDGNPQDPTDQVELVGDYVISIDTANVRTTVRFTPSAGLPSAGPSEDSPRLLVVKLPPNIVDLGGNSLSNFGNTLAVPEAIDFPEQLLPGGAGEDFSTTDFRDGGRTGARWGPAALLPGTGGGSGRLGDLSVPANQTVVLNTASQEFAPGQLIDNYDPVTGMPAAGEEAYVVDDGVFEFSRLDVAPGGVLRFEGENPARVFVRGTASVLGVVDVSGQDALEHPGLPCDSDPTLSPLDPNFCSGAPCNPAVMDPLDPEYCEEGVFEAYLESFNGGAGGAGGPAGGAGGMGADVPNTVSAELLAVGGLMNPNGSGAEDGSPGEGVPIPNLLAPTGTAAGGSPGVKYPDVFPTSLTDLGTGQFSSGCDLNQAGAPGAGGGYGTPGGNGRPLNTNGSGANMTPIALGGDPTDLGLTELVRTLDPELGFLRGGAAGGGGGAHVTRTKAVGVLCGGFFGEAEVIETFWTGSGAGGGGAGGALQVQAGDSIVLNGVIDASGGGGGRRLSGSDRLAGATGGGGGSGGAILLQSPRVAVAALPGRIDVGQGEGGLSIGQGARGGAGGAGLVRVESGLTPETAATFESLEPRLNPDATGIVDYPQPAATEDILSVGQWSGEAAGPGVVSGAQSCWLVPEGNLFFVDYGEDDPATGRLGWDMTVVIQGAELSWRTPQAGLGGMSLEDLAGSDLGSSPIVVRFQGARSVKPIENLCNVTTTGLQSPIFPGSISPWVRHPSELNDFFGTASLRPNLIRYQILFDSSNPLSNLLDGVTHVQIRSFPE